MGGLEGGRILQCKEWHLVSFLINKCFVQRDRAVCTKGLLELGKGKVKKAKLINGNSNYPITSLFRRDQWVGLLLLKSRSGCRGTLAPFWAQHSRVKESQIYIYIKIILSGMHLKHPCSLGFVPESRIPGRFYLSSGRHSLESSPKGSPVSFFSRTKQRLIFSLSPALWQGGIHFRVLLVVFKFSP